MRTLLAASTLALVLLPQAADRVAGPARTERARLPQTAPRLLDADRPAQAPTSAEVLRERLAILGASESAADQALQAASSGDENAVVAHLGLDDEAVAKAAELLAAYRDGRPVGLVGLLPSALVLDRVAQLTSEGVDPDVAAWIALGEEQDDALEPAARAASAPRLGLREEIALPGLPSQEPPATAAFCRACPSIDFMMLEPAATYRTHSSVLTAGADCKLYRFIARANRTYRFTFCEGGGTAAFNTALQALDGTCFTIAANDDSCGTLSSLDVTLPAAGYIYVKVADTAMLGGSYTLAYADVTAATGGACSTCPAFDHGTYSPTPSWQTHSGEVGVGGCKLYRFAVSGNRRYRFSMCDGGGTASFDAGLDVLRSNCGAGPSADDTCGLLPEVNVATTTAGYLYVRVRGTGGPYTLAYRDTSSECATCPDFNAGPFTPQQQYVTTSGVFDGLSPCRKLGFNLTAGRLYRFTFCQGGGSVAFDPSLLIQETTCNGLSTSNDDGPCGAPSELDYLASTTGLHLLDISSQSGTGPYRLAYVELRRPCGEASATLSMPTTAYQTIPLGLGTDNLPPGGRRNYLVNLNTNITYRFSLCSGLADNTPGTAGFDSLLSIASGCGATLASNDDSCGTASELVFSPVSAGPYWLFVEGKTPTDGGPFRLAYAEIRRSCPASHQSITPNAAGTNVTFTLLRDGNRVLAHVVTGQVRHLYTTCPASTGVAQPLDTRLELADGSTMACTSLATATATCGDDASILFLNTNPNPRVHLLTASLDSATAAGSVTLRHQLVTNCMMPDAQAAVPTAGSWFKYPAATTDSVAQNSFDIIEVPLPAAGTPTTLSLQLCGRSGGSAGQRPKGSASFNATMVLHRSVSGTCTQLVSSTNGCAAPNDSGLGNPVITYTIPAGQTGPFYVKVVGDDPATNFGTYELAYRFD